MIKKSKEYSYLKEVQALNIDKEIEKSDFDQILKNLSKEEPLSKKKEKERK